MTASIPKITRPALKGVAARPHLFNRLDRLSRRHAIAWVSAPAGSGKTTLAASWVAARGRPCLWYQVDAGDADPATFFYYLREAVSRLAPRRRETLPLLTPEYALSLPVYARNFLEALGARAPAGTVIALDDFQELPEDAPLQAVLPQALAALPEAVRVVVLSRAAAPAPFARRIAEGAVGFLEPEELDLSAGEAQALARARLGGRLGRAAVDAVRAQTHGWVAGTVLLLEAGTRTLPPPRLAQTAAQQVLFDYFASEIFERAPASTRHLLLSTALLPEVSLPAAEALAGEPRAPEILADLVRRNYFTLRLAGPQPRYRYHPLFREFLLSRARQALDADAWRAAAGRAAEFLAAEGNAEGAAAILGEAGAFEQLAALVRAHAPQLARQGRLATVESWLRALPAPMVSADPWLTYWHGLSRMHDLPRARASLEAAYRAFRERRDVTGALLAWASCVKTYLFVGGEFHSLDAWIAEMEELRGDLPPALASPEVEAEVASSMYGCLVSRAPAHRDLEAWEARSLALLDADLPVDLRMLIVQYPLAFRINWLGDYAGARQLMERVRPLVAHPDVPPLTKVLWAICEAMYAARTGGAAACFAAVERGLGIAKWSGVLAPQHLLAAQGVHGALAAGDLEAARRYHAIAQEHLRPQDAVDRGHHLYLAAWIALCAGDVASAEEHARASLADLVESGLALGPAWGELTLAHVLVERGAHGEAVQRLERVLAWGREIGSLSLEHEALLALAYARAAQGRAPDAVQPLREALRLGRERGFVAHVWMGWRRDVLARLASLALQHGIEVEYVGRIIEERGLAPPDDAVAAQAWRWPVRIRMLGGFELWRDGERASFRGKVPRRPLELLRALVALGGAEVREDALLEALWPDSDGDSAAHALETTLYRLRKLLGAPGAIARQENRISLDPRVCWVDALALSRQLPRALDAVGRPRADAAEVHRAAALLLELYRGALVSAGRGSGDCTDVMRERLRAQLSRFLEEAAVHLERAGEARAAAAYAARAREADPALLHGAQA